MQLGRLSETLDRIICGNLEANSGNFWRESPAEIQLDPAERGVDLSAAQFVDLPTRDVLVVFDNEGDREFIGFGSAKANQFADCYISGNELPADTIRVSRHPSAQPNIKGPERWRSVYRGGTHF